MNPLRLVIFTRFRDLPDDQMKHLVEYIESGRPIIGLRTATHAFDIKGSPTLNGQVIALNEADTDYESKNPVTRSNGVMSIGGTGVGATLTTGGSTVTGVGATLTTGGSTLTVGGSDIDLMAASTP